MPKEGSEPQGVGDLLPLATSQRIDVVEMLSCAPAFAALDPNFGPCSKTGFQVQEWWKGKAFEPAEAAMTGPKKASRSRGRLARDVCGRLAGEVQIQNLESCTR